MLSGTTSGCINHPSVEATHRCKQCSKPMCASCVTVGPTGNFCSVGCKEKNEVFFKRAQQLDGRARTSIFVKLRGFIGWLILIAIIAVALGVIGALFDVPVLSPLVENIRYRIDI